MTRKSLRPHLNQIRTWVRQGRTDAWIAHQLEVTVQQIGSFKRENELAPDGEAGPSTEEIDLRAEDDEAIAAELEAEAARRAEEEAAAARKAEEEAAARAAAGEDEEEDGATDEDADPDAKPAPRRRSRRGGRGRRRASQQPFEATFDHGEEGYGLWLDPDVQDDPIYAEHWAGHRAVEVSITEDQIVITRAGAGAGDDG